MERDSLNERSFLSRSFIPCGICGFSQSDDECCNNCEEVREAYRKKGWALTNADLIDQVGILFFPLRFECYRTSFFNSILYHI